MGRLMCISPFLVDGGGLAAEHPTALSFSVGPPQIHAVAVAVHPHPTSIGPPTPPTTAQHPPSTSASLPSMVSPDLGGGPEAALPHTSRAPHGARRQAAMPFVPLGTHGSSAALGFSLLFWKFKTFTGRPTRALLATERSIWLTPLLSLAAAPSCSSSAGLFLHPSPYFFSPFFSLFFFLSPYGVSSPDNTLSWENLLWCWWGHSPMSFIPLCATSPCADLALCWEGQRDAAPALMSSA